jgi:hypothetical protein
MPCTTPCRAIHRSPPGCTRASLASRLRAARLVVGRLRLAGRLRRPSVRSFVCRRGRTPGDVVVRHITFLSFHLPLHYLYLVLGHQWPHLTSDQPHPPRRSISHLTSHSPAIHCLPLFSCLPPVLFIDQHTHFAARHGYQQNQRYLRRPI